MGVTSPQLKITKCALYFELYFGSFLGRVECVLDNYTLALI